MPQTGTTMAAAPQGKAQSARPETPPWEEVLRFWFPDSPDEDLETHNRHWRWRMRGGADEEIATRFPDLAARAAAGDLDHWAADVRGRLALIIVLDQFSRSVWRNSPRAFAQDEKALALALEGLESGHFAALTRPWERMFYVIPLGHCEGPDHLARLDRAHAIAQQVWNEAPDHLKSTYAFGVEQQVLFRKVIQTFGRHTHRNATLGRTSTPEEDTYIAEGQFPHLRDF